MGRGNYSMERTCEECGKNFNPPMLRSRYCCNLCVKRASKKRMIAKAKEEQRKTLAQMIPDTKEYITIAEAVILYRISRDTLYCLVIKKAIPSINLGKKMIRLNRTYMDNQFSLAPKPKSVKKATLSRT